MCQTIYDGCNVVAIFMDVPSSDPDELKTLHTQEEPGWVHSIRSLAPALCKLHLYFLLVYAQTLHQLLQPLVLIFALPQRCASPVVIPSTLRLPAQMVCMPKLVHHARQLSSALQYCFNVPIFSTF